MVSEVLGSEPLHREETAGHPQWPEARRTRREEPRPRRSRSASGGGGRVRTEAARVPAASYLSRSWPSCSDTNAFSRRRSHGPFLGNPLLHTPGDPTGAVGATLPSPQRAMSHGGTAVPGVPRTRPHSPPPGERGVSARALGRHPNPPPKGKVTPLVSSSAVPYGSRAAVPETTEARAAPARDAGGCAQA